MKLLTRLFAPTPVVATEDSATVRNSIFSTECESGSTRLSMIKRQRNALARTFLRGIESIKPVESDGSLGKDYAMDEAYMDLTQAKLVNSSAGYLPIQQLEWYANQGFIGWQMCAVLSQNWLIDKACGLPASDAVRKGYEITVNDGDDIDPAILDEMRRIDKRFNVRGKLTSFIKKGRVFGIRHALFLIDGIDYEAPFNPDGIRPGSYKGISQIDPYWIAPMLDSQAAANPASPEFYNPTWWLVNGKKIHRTHFVIMRAGGDVVDLLKPSYFYGGIPIPQKIFERVYAAERSANEAPLLLMSKRMTTFKTDTTKIFGPDSNFNKQMEVWANYQNNFGLKVLGTEDEINQFDTSLSEVNDTIRSQFELVCAAAGLPVTKFLGTVPKGMNATGEYDEASYHEELESIQEDHCTPFVERHHLCVMRSIIAPKYGIKPINTEVNWRSLDSYTTKEQAEINEIKARTNTSYVTAGVLDALDVRQNLINDPDSGYNGIAEIVPEGPGDREFEAEQAQLMLEQPKPDAVAEDSGMHTGVLYRSVDKVLLMKRRDDDTQGGTWAFPAGKIESGETSYDAAIREFEEETGKKLKNIYLLQKDGQFILFQCFGDEFVPMLNDEHTAYVWASPDELPEPLHPGVLEQIRFGCGGGQI